MKSSIFLCLLGLASVAVGQTVATVEIKNFDGSLVEIYQDKSHKTHLPNPMMIYEGRSPLQLYVGAASEISQSTDPNGAFYRGFGQQGGGTATSMGVCVDDKGQVVCTPEFFKKIYYSEFTDVDYTRIRQEGYIAGAGWTAYKNGAVSVPASDGSTAVKLADDEFSHLQALRQAVIDEEKRLAVKYGAHIPDSIPPTQTRLSLCDRVDGCHSAPDHYSFHGQFLLIERAK